MSKAKTWQIGLLGFVVATAAIALSGSETAQALMVLWSVFCSLGIAIAGSRLSGRARRTYLLLALSGFLVVTGAVVRTLIGEATGVEQPLPSLADLLTAPGYLLFAFVALSVHRIRATHKNLDAWLDAATLTLAAVLIFWAAFLADFVTSDSSASDEIAISTFYNGVVFGAAALLVRIGATPGYRPTSYTLMGVAGLSFVIADIAGAVSGALGATLYITLALSPIVYGLLFAAAWHPSAAEIAETPPPVEERISTFRFGTSAVAIAVPAVVTLLPASQSGIGRFGTVFLSCLIAGLLVARVTRLLQSHRAVTGMESRLVEALSSLTSLNSNAEIREALPQSCSYIFGPDVTFDTGAEQTDIHSTKLRSNLCPGEENDVYVRLQPFSPDPARERIFSSFIRDAGAIADAKRATQVRATQRSEAEANKRIAANERRFRALVQNASDVVLVLNVKGHVTYMSDSAVKVLGYETSAYVGKTLDWVVHENDWGFAQGYMEAFLTGTSSHLEHEIRAVHLDGSIRLLDLVLTDMRHVEGIEGIVINITDVTEKRRLESNLRDAETTDPLTMQLNRTAFIREIDTALRRTSISASSVSLAIVNLDDFRLVNEGYGTVTADQVLIEVAHRIRQSVRLDDIVARLNGDEFGILMPDGYSAFEAERVVQRILEDVTEPITTNGRSISLRATAGLVLNGDGSATGIDMLRDADTALDTAKTTSRGSVVLFEEAMGQEVSERIELRNLLQDALKTKKLRLAYQPIVDIDTGEIAALEALSRWQDDSRGNISPATFIPIAESAGMITELGEWALRTACEQVVEWARQGYDDFTVSVNMSGHQLREENVITKVSRILRETKVDPARITIEITESVLIDDTDFIAHRIRALRELGLRLAIDDFGTGYSSLSYLRRYEFDVLKIDRSFVIPLADDANKREREIVNAMIKLAQALGAITVAEGIEEAEEYGVLRTLGCDLAQGYLFWYPMESYEVIPALNVVPTSAAA